MLLRYLTLLLIFLISSCSSLKHSVVNDSNIIPFQYKIAPGDVLLVNIPGTKSDEEVILSCKGKEIPVYFDGQYYQAFIIETYFSDKKEFVCRIGKKSTPQEKRFVVVEVSIIDKEFPFEKLNVDQAKVFYSKKDLKRIIKEKKMLEKIYKKSLERPLFKNGFKLPLNTLITSEYGKRRLFNNAKKSQHLGVDFRAKVGTKIHVTSSGKVVFAGDLFFTGNTVIVDHGLGLFSLYGHLSKLNVTQDEYLPNGAVVGISGKTGRVTGPHLHWGIKVHGNWVNGKKLAIGSDSEEVVNNR